MSFSIAVLFIAGLILLIIGAEALVRGASRLSAIVGISPLIIGLTVVAFGTSSPELAVSVNSGLKGQADIALGNVIGSNIFNILFILGLSAAITPLAVSRQLIRLDVPVMIGVSVLVLLFGFNGNVNRWEGAVLFSGIILYTAFLIYQSRKERNGKKDEFTIEYGISNGKSSRHWVINPALIVAGLGMLVLGSRWLVDSSVTIAQALGVSQLVIGLTIIAAGTSLPEVATSVIASIRGERDIAVGNVIGSNIFNILSVLGMASLVSPNGIQVSGAALRFDIPIMIAVAVACLPIFTDYIIARWEGLLFVGYYVAYTIYLILAAIQHVALSFYSQMMFLFVVPITLITLVIVKLYAFRKRVD